jgi:hypothetical protein
VRITYLKWVAVDQKYAMQVARSPEGIEELPTELRLLLVAMGKMNAAGHAHFEAPRGKPDESELRREMGHVDKRTGDRVLCAASTIYKAKQRLANAGLLVESSGGLVCVWVATDFAEKGSGGIGICPFHRANSAGWARKRPTQTERETA